MTPRDITTILNLPVIGKETGELLGTVDSALFDHAEQRLLGFALRNVDDAPGETFVHQDDVLAVGTDALIVENAGVLRALGADPDVDGIRRRGVQLQGSTVLTEQGEQVGSVDTVLVGDGGDIVAYRVRSGFLDLKKSQLDREDVVAVGHEAIIASGSAASEGKDEKSTRSE